VGAIQLYLLGHVAMLDEHHVLKLRQQYAGYCNCNGDCTHLGLAKDTPIRQAAKTTSRGVSVQRLGGLHHADIRSYFLVGAKCYVASKHRTQKGSNLMVNPTMRMFRYQVGWIGLPGFFDVAINDFIRCVPEDVGVIQQVLRIPAFGYTIEERAKHFDLIKEAFECLVDCGAEIVGQVGCNWVHSGGRTMEEIRQYLDTLYQEYGTSLHMEGMCLIDAMNHLGAQNVVLMAGYNRREWLDGYLRFLGDESFQVHDAGNLAEQGFFADDDQMSEAKYVFPDRMLTSSIVSALSKVPHADAVMIMGMPSWKAQDGTISRSIKYVSQLEKDIGLPVVSGEMALIWSILRDLKIATDKTDCRLMTTLARS